MTCVVGVVAEDRVVMSADSYGSSNGVAKAYQTPKLVSRQITTKRRIVFDGDIRVIIGYCGSYRIGNVITWGFKPPVFNVEQKLEQYLFSLFVPELMKSLSEAGCLKEESSVKTGGTLLVGIQNRLFVIQSDFSVIEPVKPYAAIGSGEEFALGALFALESSELSATDKADLAIAAASAFCQTVGGPVTALSTT